MQDLGIYHSRLYGWLVRRSHRHDPERLQKDPRFASLRRHASEIGAVARLAGIIAS